MTAMRTVSKSITNASVKKPLKATERKRQDEARISYIRKEHTKKVLREFSDADQQMGTIFSSSSLKEDINQLLQQISSAGKNNLSSTADLKLHSRLNQAFQEGSKEP